MKPLDETTLKGAVIALLEFEGMPPDATKLVIDKYGLGETAPSHIKYAAELVKVVARALDVHAKRKIKAEPETQ